MKVFIIILIFLCFSEITISQEQHKTIHSIQISAYGSIPNNFMKRYRTTKESFYQSYNQVVDPSIVSGGNIGYDQYYTMGTGITAEYIWTFKNNLSVKAGADMIMHSNYKQAYDKELAMTSCNDCYYNYYPSDCYYKQTNYNFSFGVLLGVKYSFGKRSSVFFNTSLNYFGFSYHKRTNWLNDIYKFTMPQNSYFSFFELVYYNLGYNYSFNKKISAFVLIELNENLYFGLGAKYNFNIKRK